MPIWDANIIGGDLTLRATMMAPHLNFRHSMHRHIGITLCFPYYSHHCLTYYVFYSFSQLTVTPAKVGIRSAFSWLCPQSLEQTLVRDKCSMSLFVWMKMHEDSKAHPG